MRGEQAAQTAAQTETDSPQTDDFYGKIKNQRNRIKKRVCKACIGSFTIALFLFLGVFIYREKALGDTPYQIPTECNIGGITYTKDNPMVILEIVPEMAYDELGPMIGNDQGSVTWESITDKYPAGTAQSEVETVVYKYFSLVNSAISSDSEWHLCIMDKYGTVYSDPWDISASDWTNNDSDLSNFTPVMRNENGETSFSDGTSIRNYFAKMVFGDYDMEDKIQLVVKEADQVTTSDIDQAGLIYINRQAHMGITTELYNLVYGTSIENGETWVTADCDMNASVAFYLYLQSALNGKAVIFQSADKSASNNVYSNVSRISILFCGIDRDTFITEYCSYQTSTGYAGSRGKVDFTGNTINLYYLNTNNKYKSISFSADMFLLSSNGYSSNEVGYPYYNASESRVQYSYLYKNCYQFNSDNSMTSTMLSYYIGNSDYSEDGTYLGTTYDDAYDKVGDGNEDELISPAMAIRYILGDYGYTDLDDVTEIKVLEIEPVGAYQYDASEEEDINKILSWFGLGSSDSVTVTIDHYSMNAFIGLNSDIRSDYDLVIIGAYDNNTLNDSTTGILYNTGNDSITLSGTQLSDASFRMDDLTEKAYEKLYAYVASGMPLVMDQAICYSNSNIVEDDTKLNEMGLATLKAKLIEDEKDFDNIIPVPSSSTTEKLLDYQYKPVITYSERPADYNGVSTDSGSSSLINQSDLNNMTYAGSIENCGSSYRVKIYFDRNCDSLFNEDSESGDAELFFDQISTQDADELESNGEFQITLQLPEALSGYIAWKMEVENLDNGLITEFEGAFGIRADGEERVVKVLQIVKDYDSDNLPTIDLLGDGFTDCFNATKEVTGLGLDVTVLTKSQFNQQINNNPKLLNNYSIVVCGMNDNYGNDEVLSDAANTAIANYISAGNSVLFTHDCMSYKKNNSAALTASNLNSFTKKFKTVIGMQDGYALTDSLVQKLTQTNIYSSVKSSTNTITTTKVKKLNDGQITSYPYQLDEEEMEVATTHGQYFKLNLEEQEDQEDVTVWYTLAADDASEYSEYYELSGQDALNNYYIYSKGNVTYTSAGHDHISDDVDDAELQLFVNTFIRAIMSGNSVPEVEFDDATKESSTMYSLLLRDAITTSVEELNFQFTVSDSDLVNEKGYLEETFLFYDADDNDEYDESEDVVLGYIYWDGTITGSKLDEDTNAAISGHTYSCDLIEVINNCECADSIKTKMLQKLVNNQLKIGIVAEDEGGATGYAIQKIIQRQLFELN